MTIFQYSDIYFFLIIDSFRECPTFVIKPSVKQHESRLFGFLMAGKFVSKSGQDGRTVTRII